MTDDWDDDTDTLPPGMFPEPTPEAIAELESRPQVKEESRVVRVLQGKLQTYMLLTDLEPQLVKAVSETRWQHVDTLAEADGVHFTCPKCRDHELLVWFSGRDVPQALEPAARWSASGKSLHDLTLWPSVNVTSGCCAHFFLTDGRVKDA